MNTKSVIGIALVGLQLMFVGCRGKENKYVGTYVEEDRPGPPGIRGFRTVLDLYRDGTYKFQTSEDSVTTGEWTAVKSQGQEDIEFTPSPSPLGVSLRQTKKRGYCFVLPTFGGEIILSKQAPDNSISTQSSELLATKRATPSRAADSLDSVEQPTRVGSEPVDTTSVGTSTVAPGSPNDDKVGRMQAAPTQVDRTRAARTQISQLEVALDAFEIDVGRYPANAEGLRALVEKPTSNADGWQQGYLKSVPQDPWGRDYIYRYPGQYNQDGYDLYSYGPDGKLGGDDDITNWSEAH
jgi:general secretion pathway protein G